MKRVDVLVIGAGPAGTAAAIGARRAGLEATIVDRAALGRDKCCGDGLTALALRELEDIGLRPERLDSWMPVDAALVRTPRGRTMRLPLPHGSGQFAAICRRTDLDAALVELAAAAGADLRLGITFTGFDHDAALANSVVASFNDGSSVAARFVVAADGVYSGVRKAAGIGPPRYRGDWHAFRGYRAADGTAARGLWVWFEPDLLPGYAWSFPLGDGRVNFGFGVPRSAGGALDGGEIAGIWSSLAQRPHIAEVLGNNEPDGPTRAWPIPARVGDLRLAQGRVVLCGDAAAAADPLTGEGIGQALQMGRMAADAIARGGPPNSVTARYTREVRAALVADHRLARALSQVLAHEWLAEIALGTVDLAPWTRRQFARWMFEDYPRAAVATPRRWHRGITAPQGAYAAVGPAVASTAPVSPS